MSTPPASPAPHAESRAARAALAAFGVCLLALVAYRGYGPQVAARPTEVVAAAVDLNAASPGELRQLPGVGPALAGRIAGHGGFDSVDQLQDVPGVGGQTFARLSPHLTAHPGGPPPDAERLERKPVAPPPPTSPTKIQRGEPKIDVNAAPAAALQRLPGIGPTLAARIVEARAAGPFAAVDDLRRVKGIGAKTLEAVRPFVRCD